MNEIALDILGIICCFISIIGGILIIIAYYKLPELKTFGNKMIMYVGMSNTIYSMQAILEFSFGMSGLYEDDGFCALCKIQGFISTYTSQCMLIWITILSITIHNTVKSRIVNMSNRERIFIFLGFIIPLILSSIPFLTNSYGRENGVCWITSNAGKVAQLLQVWGLFYGQLWLCIFINFALILNTMRMLKKLNIDNTETYFVIRRFLYYPFLWIICWIFGTIKRLIMTTGGENISILMDIHIILTSLQGFFTMIIFFSEQRILNAIKNRISQSNKQIYAKGFNDGKSHESHSQNNQLQQKLVDNEDSDYFDDINQTGSVSDIEKNNPSKQCQQNDLDYSPLSNSEQKNQQNSINPLNSALKVENCHDNINQNKSNSQQNRNSNSNNNKNQQIKQVMSQKKQFQAAGKWNRMEKINEDSDEELFDKEIQLKNIQNSEQLVLSKNDTKLIYKQRKISVSNQNDNLQKRQQE